MTSIAGLMTWFGICIVRILFHCFRAWSTSLTFEPSGADLPPVPGRLERSRSRPGPPPVQIFPSTLRGVVRSHHDRRDPPPQRFLRLHSGPLGHGDLYHVLHPSDVRPDLVCRREFRDEEQVRQGRGYGLCHGLGRSDRGYLR